MSQLSINDILVKDFASIELHNTAIPIKVLPEDQTFGLLSVKLQKIPITKQPCFILFTIDRTASMDEPGGKGMSKLQHLKYTFANMMRFLAKQDAEIYVHVHAFNSDVEVIVNTVQINTHNIESIIAKIQELAAVGSTNIGSAILGANAVINEYTADPLRPWNTMHIFMTDGEPSEGLTDYNALASMVDTKFSNTFFGFGLDHNPTLLLKCAGKKNAQYDLIDNMERAGVVYGNVIHGLLYPALKDVRIFVENARIYDWTKNKWTNEIREQSWTSESTRNYHMSVPLGNENDVIAVIFGCIPGQSEEVLLDTIDILPSLMSTQTGDIELADHSKYMFRQAVQEELFRARTETNPNISAMKTRIGCLFRKMRRFMRDRKLLKDPMMIQLCDDLSVSYMTLGTEYGVMYAAQRQGSQGRQQGNTSSTPVIHATRRGPTPMPLGRHRRGRAISALSDNNDEDSDDDYVDLGQSSQTVHFDTIPYDVGGPMDVDNISEVSMADSNASTVVPSINLSTSPPPPPMTPPVLRRYRHEEVFYPLTTTYPITNLIERMDAVDHDEEDPRTTYTYSGRSTASLRVSTTFGEVPRQNMSHINDDNLSVYSDLDTTMAYQTGIVRNIGYCGERHPETKKKHGFGKYTYSNGDVYIGDWENNWWNGQGRYKFANGRVFEGEFVFGVWQGSDVPTYLEEPLNLIENNIGDNDLGDTWSDDDIENYICSDNTISAYATPIAVDTMRTMSQLNT